MGNILETKNLCKVYGKQKSNNNISIHVREGSVYGLLGPNGAGKSTFLKMISGMSTPTSGEIYFEGEKWSRNSLERIGSLIESPPIYGNLTAWENGKVRALMYGVSEERINEVLSIVELENTGKKVASKFSMGMKQRLGIAMALINSPKLLILDEPTNGLDPVGIENVRNMIRGFIEKGITVIISSHILPEIQKIADDIGIIVNGKLVYEFENNHTEDLEKLFMDVIKKEGGYND